MFCISLAAFIDSWVYVTFCFQHPLGLVSSCSCICLFVVFSCILFKNSVGFNCEELLSIMHNRGKFCQNSSNQLKSFTFVYFENLFRAKIRCVCFVFVTPLIGVIGFTGFYCLSTVWDSDIVKVDIIHHGKHLLSTKNHLLELRINWCGVEVFLFVFQPICSDFSLSRSYFLTLKT